jgi:uncharacterized protein (TIGR00299 family) protein
LPSGISGDIFLSCLVDAGWELSRLQAVIDSLKLPESCKVEATRVQRKGIGATHVDVHTPHTHQHRHLHHIEKIINDADLPQTVKNRAIAVFTRLAAAEAKVHGTTIQKVHFHEVGALDAIIDIVGTCAGLEALGITQLYASPVPLGWGWVNCDHGQMPVPAPATLELIAAASVPTRQSPGGGELVTPTGAALIAELAQFRQAAMKPVKLGTGTGTRDPEWPNVARLLIGEPLDAAGIVEIATNIDDMNPQLYAPVMDKLLSAGALDCWLVPVQMKKGRPGIVLHILARAADEQKLASLVLRETTTLGVRVLPVTRHEAGRDFRTVTTAFGDVQLKLKLVDGKIIGATPEFEDCRKLADAKGVAIKDVVEAAAAQARALL